MLHLGSTWRRFRNTKFRSWIDIHASVLKNIKVPMHIVRYERLKLYPTNEMRTLVNFLGWNITERQLACVLKNSEGKFHRPTSTSTIDPWAGFDRVEHEAVLKRIDRWPDVA